MNERELTEKEESKALERLEELVGTAKNLIKLREIKDKADPDTAAIAYMHQHLDHEEFIVFLMWCAKRDPRAFRMIEATKKLMKENVSSG